MGHVCIFHELFIPSWVKDASSVNKMTLNSWGVCCYPVAQIHTLSRVRWFQKLYPVIMIRM